MADKQRAESREQGAGSREQGAEGRGRMYFNVAQASLISEFTKRLSIANIMTLKIF